MWGFKWLCLRDLLHTFKPRYLWNDRKYMALPRAFAQRGHQYRVLANNLTAPIRFCTPVSYGDQKHQCQRE
jgi:hypothetical protein